MLAAAPPLTPASLSVKLFAHSRWFYPDKIPPLAHTIFFFFLPNLAEKRGFVRPLVINERASRVYATSTQLSSKCSVTWQ